MKRIFIGLKISKKLQSEIAKQRRKYSRLPARWIDEKNLHITLIPPFYTSSSGSLKITLKNIENYSRPVVVKLDRISFGPDPKRPRLIWATGKTPDNLPNLKKCLHKILKIPAEKRPFSLHLTLARFKPQDFRNFSIKKLDEKIIWKDKIKSIMLFESKLSPKGAEYRILEEVKFKK